MIVTLYLVAYKIGRSFAPGNAPGDPPPFSFNVGMHPWFSPFISWVAGLGKPLLIGVPMLTLALASIGYFMANLSWRWYAIIAWRLYQRRRLKKKAA
jgi:hypothetical protein